MRTHSWLALALVFGGCSGGTTKDTTDVPGDDDDDDTDGPTDGGGDSGGGFGGDLLTEVAAVGFEFDGILLSDGTFTSFTYGSYEIPPTLYLTFTTADYFAATEYQQEEESCVAFGGWSPTPLPAANNIPAVGNPTLNWSWEEPILLEYSDCPDKMDPALWKEILAAFTGARFGMGLSTMNQTFLDKWGISDYPDYIDFYETNGLVQYIALNDRDGDFIARNWNLGLIWEWDSGSGELSTDGGYLVSVPVDTTPAGAPLPEGYLTSNSFWYADFCSFLDDNGYQASAEESCIDMANLHDGAR